MEQQLQYHIYKSYDILYKIGKGTYGQVYRAIHRKTNQPVAIKKIEDAFINLTDAKRTYRELNYLFQLQHPCIVKLQRVIPSKYNFHVYAVFDLVEFDLAKTLSMCSLEKIQRKYISCQLLQALQYLHESGLIHRDIKPSNVLIDANCDIKLCDFGLTRLVNSFSSNERQLIMTQYVAARWYRPPEVILGLCNYRQSIDLWSVGCLMAELSLKQPLFKGSGTLNQLEKIFQVIGMPSKQYITTIGSLEAQFLLKNFPKVRRTQLSEVLLEASDQEIDLILSLLKLQPSHRISAKDALEHPYFLELKEEKARFYMPPIRIVECPERKTVDEYRSLIEQLQKITNRSVATYRTNTAFNDIGSMDHIKETQKEHFMTFLNDQCPKTQEFRDISTRDSNLLLQHKKNKSVSRISQKSKKSSGKNTRHQNLDKRKKRKKSLNNTSKSKIFPNSSKFIQENVKLSSARLKGTTQSKSKPSLFKGNTVNLSQATIINRQRLSKKLIKKKSSNSNWAQVPNAVKSSDSLLKRESFLPKKKQ